MKFEEELLFVLRTPHTKMNAYDKLIQIERLVTQNKFDPHECAKNLGITVGMVEAPPQETVVEDPAKAYPNVSTYLVAFRDGYRAITGLEFDQSNADMGQLKLIRKRCTIFEFRKFMNYLVDIHGKVSKADDFEVWVMVDDPAPYKIYKRLNVLRRRMTEAEGGVGVFDYGFLKNKGGG